MPPGSIKFRYDTHNEILIAEVHWDIKTRENVLAWYQQWVDYMTKHFPGRRVDFIVVVDDLKVDPRVGQFWGEHRALLHKNYGRLSYRVNCTAAVRTFTLTSAVRYDISSAEARTLEEAVAGIKAARLQAEQGLLGEAMMARMKNGSGG